ncbi:MAG: PilZ domain-containing protein [Acidobacteriota bacterium]
MEPVAGTDGVRSFSRIRHAFKVELRPLPAAEVEMVTARILSQPSLDSFEALSPGSEPGQNELIDLFRTIVARLDRLEHKIDRALEAIDQMGRPETGLEGGEAAFAAEAFDLSGSGVGVLSPQPFELGQNMALILHLPGRPAALLKAVGSVASLLPAAEGQEAGHYRLGIRFTAINENDRQLLVRFIFQRQRALLRSAQLD